MSGGERLREIVGKMTPQPWKAWAMDLLWDKAGDSDIYKAVPVARFFTLDEHGKQRTFDLQGVQLLRNCADELLAIVESARALCDVLGDRVHDRLKANERHWHEATKHALRALDAKLEGEG